MERGHGTRVQNESMGPSDQGRGELGAWAQATKHRGMKNQGTMHRGRKHRGHSGERGHGVRPKDVALQAEEEEEEEAEEARAGRQRGRRKHRRGGIEKGAHAEKTRCQSLPSLLVVVAAEVSEPSTPHSRGCACTRIRVMSPCSLHAAAPPPRVARHLPPRTPHTPHAQRKRITHARTHAPHTCSDSSHALFPLADPPAPSDHA
mmetsp:Transcript_32362/g.84868  ORF Transcript_32362/g.84868 Transcript_32362/m.84868 type:complete len:204 (-) Transcript_32362:37-648(-)